MGGHRQGEGQVAFIGEPAFVEPPDGVQFHGHTADDDGNEGEDHGQHAQHNGHILLGVQLADPHQIPHGQSAHQSGAEADQAQQTQKSPGGPPFIFQQFGKHLNTSRNSSSRDFPVSSRVSSAMPRRTTLPWYKNTNSSSTRSTSAIRWVEITTVAVGS